MNLHGIVSGMVAEVNPMQQARVRLSIGYGTAADGSRSASFGPDVFLQAQVQDLSQRDIQHLDGLNVQGSQKVVYLSGELSGLIRPLAKGGDLVILRDGTWLVTAVLEQWPDWVKAAITLQDGG